MNCPKCIGKLEEKIVENTTVDICWVCEGVWFDFEELEKVLAADSKNFNSISIDRKELDGKEASELQNELNEKIGKCPRCASEVRLERQSYPKRVFIDTCPSCKGIWLDGGEIHKLRDRTLIKLADGFYSFKTALINSLRLAIQSGKRRKIR